MTRRFLLLCILAILQSCSSVHWNIIEREDCTPSLLFPQTIVLDSTLSVVSWIRVGDHVVMTVPNDNAVIHVYSYPEFKFESQYLLYGRAADEYLSANLVEGNINDTFALYDMNNKFIKEYEFNSLGITEISKVDLKGKNARRSSVLPPYVNILRISDDVHLFRIADATIEELRLIGLTDWKEYGDLYDMLTIRDKNVDQYMDYFCCLDATSDYIVRAYETIDKIDIYKFDNEQFHPWLSIESTPLKITGDSYYFDRSIMPENHIQKIVGEVFMSNVGSRETAILALRAPDFLGRFLSTIPYNGESFLSFFTRELDAASSEQRLRGGVVDNIGDFDHALNCTCAIVDCSSRLGMPKERMDKVIERDKQKRRSYEREHE